MSDPATHDLADDEPDDVDIDIAREAVSNPYYPAIIDSCSCALEFVTRLTDERHRQGLTQAQVAAAIGSTRAMVGRIERREVDPPMGTLAAFAAVVLALRPAD